MARVQSGWGDTKAGPQSALRPSVSAPGAAGGAALTYDQIVREQGATYDPETGFWVRYVPDGSKEPRQRADGKWVQPHQKRFVAGSLEEARDNSRSGQAQWDFYAVGIRCSKPGCDSVLSGWVRGGSKFEREHDHVFHNAYAREFEMEIAPSADGSGVTQE